jgi:serine/threonine protein kinase/tetratricopeptide (TPR) repeat protein
MASLVGKRVAHYDVVEKIGEGGMGVVYRARDRHLDRDVALKLLTRRAVVDDSSRTRFLKEALALSRLNHPVIATVHDFDRFRRTDFLVMEFIPGITLSERLKHGPFTEAEILHLAIQLADGLAAAHLKGIIHRDLKPGNVRLTPDGRAKILDFGLAKVIQRGDETRDASITQDQAVVGTLPYMAPEQIMGDPIDVRTDIYGLGAVLYEMATGRRPFPESQTSRLIYSILYERPDAPSKVNPLISPGLEEIVLCTLEKDPDRRFASVDDLAAAAKRLRDGPPGGSSAPVELRGRTGQIDSIVVLPLDNLSGDPSEDYLADGLTEALISDLAKLGALRVISRTSAMQYKRTPKPLPEIARELRVDAVLEGTFQRQGGRVRVNAQLIRAATDEHLWAESYDRTMDDLLTLQSEVSRSVAHEISLKLRPQEEAVLSRMPSVDAEAHELYLRGRYFWNRRDMEGLKRAIAYFKQATERAPQYALAYAGLADAYTILANWSVLRPSEAYPHAKEAASRALELDGTLAEAHVALAFAQHLYDWNWAEAELGFKRAIRLNPSYAAGHSWYALFLATRKRHDESIAEGRRSQEVDPLSPIINSTASWVQYEARQYGEAIRQCRAFLERDASFPQTYLILGLACTQEKRYDEAIAAYEKGLALSGGLSELYAALGVALGVSGRKAEARRVGEEMEKLSAARYVPPYSRGLVEVGLGNEERALELLEESCEHRNTWLILLGVEPMFDRLRSEPRFQSIVRRVGLPL